MKTPWSPSAAAHSSSSRRNELRWTIPSVLTPGKSCRKRRKIAASATLFNAKSKEMTRRWPRKSESHTSNSRLRISSAKLLKKQSKLWKNTTKRWTGTCLLAWMALNTTHLPTEQTQWMDISKNLRPHRSHRNSTWPKIQTKLKRFTDQAGMGRTKKDVNFQWLQKSLLFQLSVGNYRPL